MLSRSLRRRADTPRRSRCCRCEMTSFRPTPSEHNCAPCERLSGGGAVHARRDDRRAGVFQRSSGAVFRHALLAVIATVWYRERLVRPSRRSCWHHSPLKHTTRGIRRSYRSTRRRTSRDSSFAVLAVVVVLVTVRCNERVRLRNIWPTAYGEQRERLEVTLEHWRRRDGSGRLRDGSPTSIRW